jgi:hypothetical protein
LIGILRGPDQGRPDLAIEVRVDDRRVHVRLASHGGGVAEVLGRL